MSLLFIHARNSHFHSCDDGAEYGHPEDALVQGVQSAVALAADEINRGERTAAVEVSIQSEDGTQLLCSVVAICVSPLMLAGGLAKPAIALTIPG